MSIVLASASPRRRELMAQITDEKPVIIPARGEENPPAGAGPELTVLSLSLAKAEEVAAKCSQEDVIIAADTIVSCGGRILGKPHSESEAEEMLKLLSGRRHEVYTGVTVIAHGRVLNEAECSAVYFRELDSEEIKKYIRTGEPMDKAGAYGIQGKAGVFVEKIEGDYYNIVGLPLCRLCKMLKELGVELI